MTKEEKAYLEINTSRLTQKQLEKNVKILANSENYGNDMFLNNGSKFYWRYRANVLLLRGYPKVKNVIPELYNWLQDINWPGADEIMKLLSTFPRDVLVSSFEEAVGRAVKQNDEEWMLFLYEFAENNNIIESEFENKELFKIIEDYYTSLY